MPICCHAIEPVNKVVMPPLFHVLQHELVWYSNDHHSLALNNRNPDMIEKKRKSVKTVKSLRCSI